MQIPLAKKLRRQMPPMETLLWSRLRKLRPAGLHFRRQVPIGAFIVDFACLKSRLVVELDGVQHGEVLHAKRDAARDAELAVHGFRVLRIRNGQLREDSDSVVATIIAFAADADLMPQRE